MLSFLLFHPPPLSAKSLLNSPFCHHISLFLIWWLCISRCLAHSYSRFSPSSANLWSDDTRICVYSSSIYGTITLWCPIFILLIHSIFISKEHFFVISIFRWPNLINHCNFAMRTQVVIFISVCALWILYKQSITTLCASWFLANCHKGVNTYPNICLSETYTRSFDLCVDTEWSVITRCSVSIVMHRQTN